MLLSLLLCLSLYSCTPKIVTSGFLELLKVEVDGPDVFMAGASLEVHFHLEIISESFGSCSMRMVSSLNWLRSLGKVHLTLLQPHFESTALWEGSDGDLEKQLTNMMTSLGHH